MKPSEDEVQPTDPSKSQRKRDMTALQELGQQLASANAVTLSKCELPDFLQRAINEYKRLPNKHGAQRRQMQYIGKLMRELDDAMIEQIHSQMNLNVEMEKRRFHRIEELRDRLLASDNQQLATMLAEHPQIDAKQIGQLVRQARKEAERNQAPGSARKLFKLLRESLES